MDYSALLVEQLDDPAFSVRFDINGSQTQPAGVAPRIGAGAVLGDDSELWVIDDLSGLDGAHFVAGSQGTGDVFSHGAVIGSSATTAVAMATKLVDGTLYSLDRLGYWREEDASAASTVPGHVFEMLREVESFEVIGPDTTDGTGLVTLRPTSPVAYDLADLALNEAFVGDSGFDTRIVVDESGVLVRVEVEMDASSPDYSWWVAFDIVGLGDIAAIEPPDETWVSAASLGFGIPEGVIVSDGITTLVANEAWVHFDLPASWRVSSSPDGDLFVEPPGGTEVGFFSLFNEEVDIEEHLRDMVAEVGIEVSETIRTDVGGFPSLLITGTHPDGHAMFYAQSLAGLSFLAIGKLPTLDSDVQRAQLTEVLQTVELRNPASEVVPGWSIGDSELQRDTMAIVTEMAASAAGNGCASAEVLWTQVTGSQQGEWTEDWLVDACGDLQVLDVTFVQAVQGGTDIIMGKPFRYAEATVPLHHGDIGDDPVLAATLLREQPWLLDPALDLDEVDLAASVQRARFDGARLHVLVLASSLTDRFDDYLDTVTAHLAGGTVLLIDADQAAARAHNGAYLQTDLQDALDAAAASASTETMVDAFVTTLHPGA